MPNNGLSRFEELRKISRHKNNMIWFVAVAAYIIWLAISGIAYGEMFLGPQLQACVVYYDEHKAVINVPGSVDWSDPDIPCSVQMSNTALQLFQSQGYVVQGGHLPDTPFTSQAILVKP